VRKSIRNSEMVLTDKRADEVRKMGKREEGEGGERAGCREEERGEKVDG
jgi:hypothetical protein